jgi:chemotaxis protein methyltransferase CheR
MADATPIAPEAFRLLRDLVHEGIGVTVPEERSALLASRLAPRLAATGCRDFMEYYRLLRYGGDGELDEAIDAVVNNETYFYRETVQLEVLVQLVAGTSRAVRILSAGCSTGEEAYTLAMMLHDAGVPAPAVNVVALDVSARAIRTSREAAYGEHSFRGVEDGVRERFFDLEAARWRVREDIRRRVTFVKANLLDTAVPGTLGGFDAVLCRNVTIYFDEAAKERAIANLYELVVPGGLLLLGHSESLYKQQHGFDMVRLGRAIGYRRPPQAAEEARRA